MSIRASTVILGLVLAGFFGVHAFAGMKDHPFPSTDEMRASTPLPSDPNRVIHFVRPHDTDPQIDSFLVDHYVMYSKSVAKNGKLFLFFPGTNATPSIYQWVLSVAAERGFMAIGLEYPNGSGTHQNSSVAQICRGKGADCPGLVREARIKGNRAWPSVNVNKANSMLNRIEKLLVHLHKNFPTEGWDQFLSNGDMAWEKFVLAGHSQGAGMAAFIAKEHRVARVALFSGGPDIVNGKLASWISSDSATPAERYSGLIHLDESRLSLRLRGFAKLGIDQDPYEFGPSNKDKPIPFGVRIFTLALDPVDVRTHGDLAHSSVVIDRSTPLGKNGRPLYSPVWASLMGQ
jgi:hypothetical protein